MEVLDVPSAELLQEATRTKLFFDEDLYPLITPNREGKIRSDLTSCTSYFRHPPVTG